MKTLTLICTLTLAMLATPVFAYLDCSYPNVIEIEKVKGENGEYRYLVHQICTKRGWVSEEEFLDMARGK